MGLRTKEISSSSEIGDLAEASPASSDYSRVGIARSGKIFHSWPPETDEVVDLSKQVDAKVVCTSVKLPMATVWMCCEKPYSQAARCV
jgi:hypothetical protein